MVVVLSVVFGYLLWENCKKCDFSGPQAASLLMQQRQPKPNDLFAHLSATLHQPPEFAVSECWQMLGDK